MADQRLFEIVEDYFFANEKRNVDELLRHLKEYDHGPFPTIVSKELKSVFQTTCMDIGMQRSKVRALEKALEEAEVIGYTWPVTDVYFDDSPYWGDTVSQTSAERFIKQLCDVLHEEKTRPESLRATS